MARRANSIPATPAADDGYVLALFGLGHGVVLGFVSGVGVQRAVAELAEAAGSALPGADGQAAQVAGDARTDVLLAAFAQLGYILALGEVLPADADEVELAGGYGLGSRVGLHTSGADDGLAGEGLDLSGLLQVGVERHIDGRMPDSTGVVGAVVRSRRRPLRPR